MPAQTEVRTLLKYHYEDTQQHSCDQTASAPTDSSTLIQPVSPNLRQMLKEQICMRSDVIHQRSGLKGRPVWSLMEVIIIT